MGRELRRVPLDFDWPIDKVWGGFLMPARLSENQCAVCAGDGYSPEARAIAETFYPHMIRGADRATQDALAWNNKIGQAEVDNLVANGRLTGPVTAAEVNAAQRGSGSFGLHHDGINRWMLTSFRCERLGIPEKCTNCEGHGHIEAYPGQRAEAEVWEPTEPPAGEGWQVWETVSEGSPITPVFPTADALIDHLVNVGAWRKKWSREAAGNFVNNDGWAPSLIVTNGQVIAPGDTIESKDK